MKDWEKLFSRTILSRGREYFQDGRVRDLRSQGEDAYVATVWGKHSYRVQIRFEPDGEPVMRCSCPYIVTWADKCKHMAAVMCAIEDRYGVDDGDTEPGVLRPFRNEGKPSHYFDMNTIAGHLCISEKEFRRAEQIVAERLYEEPARIEFGYVSHQGTNGFLGTVSVWFRESTKREQCQFRFSAENILLGSCSCQVWDPYGYTRRNKRICRHQAAALLLVRDYIEKYDPGDSTDYAGAELLRSFRRGDGQPSLRDSAAGASVRLEPRLLQEGDRLSLSFKIGAGGRMYVVRKINDLVSAVSAGKKYPLGRNAAIDFSAAGFDGESGPVYDLITGFLAGERRREERPYANHYYSGAPEIKQTLPLYGSTLDVFYDACLGRSVEVRYEGENHRYVETRCRLEDGDPTLTLSVSQDRGRGGGFRGVRISGEMPSLFDGAAHQYYMNGERLSRVSRDFMKRIRPLRTLGSGDISFTVGRKNLSEFYYSVLPKLRESFIVLEPDGDVIADLLPPEPSYVFYLDALDGVPMCRAAVLYGEQEFLLSDWDAGRPIDRLLRSEQDELRVRDTVIRYFPDCNTAAEEYLCPEDEEAVYEVLTKGVSDLMAAGEVRSTARFDGLRIHRRVRVSVGVSLESDLLDLSVTSEDLSPQELLEVLDSYRKKKTYHRLRNGDFVRMDESVAELSMMMDAMRLTPKQLIAGKTHIPAYRALYLDKMLEQCEELDAARNRQFRLIAKDFRTVNDSDFEVPDSLRETMRGYQQYGHKWLRTLAAYRFGGILADDMGLGKTIQVISVLLAAKEAGEKGTSIVITPASLVYNWQEEFRKFAPALSVCPVVGTQTERQELIREYANHDVLITSYDLLKRDVSRYEDCTFFYEVIDEAQYIKNHNTAAAKSVKILNSRHRAALTGTPIENRLSELWSIFDFLMPGFLYGYDTFRKELETPIARRKDEEATLRLNRMVAPFILRRLKGNVLKDLPEKLEETRYTRLENEQRKVYDGQVVRIRELLMDQSEDSFAKGKIQILAELTRIRQICCDPSLLFENYRGGSAKREACIDLIRSAMEGEHRVLLFSQFTSMLALLERDLEAKGIAYFKITGATQKAERLELVKRFNEGDVPVFLISLKAGGTGLNLTGADVVIHYDPWWNVAAQNQATDRAHRIGQEKVVTVYKLIARDTIEERIQELQESKRELADAVLNGESVSIADMTKEDLLALLR